MSKIEEAIVQAELEQEIIALRKANLNLQTKLIKAKSKVDDLVAATQEAAYEAVITLGNKPALTPKKDTRKARAQVALWHLTDWQGGKKTPTYNSEVMAERVSLFVERAEKLTNAQRQDHPIKHCVIAFGGDMVEGVSFNFPTQPFEIDQTIFGQYVTVSKTIVETVKQALRIYETVTVIPEWGNHGRIGSTRDVVPRSDNFDRMVYELAKQVLAGEPRLTWQDCPEDIQRIWIPPNTSAGKGYRALLIHGDEIGRNGFASPATLVSAVARWQSGAYPWEFTDVYTGHYHNHLEFSLPNGMGSVYQTGSTESENRYASVLLAATAVPSQRLHFIDPDKGRVTTTHKVWLDERN